MELDVVWVDDSLAHLSAARPGFIGDLDLASLSHGVIEQREHFLTVLSACAYGRLARDFIQKWNELGREKRLKPCY
jgi:hypothetical protein